MGAATGGERQGAKAGEPRKKGHAREIAEAVVIALVLALIIRTFLVQAFKIPSGSMEDTLLVGDHIVVSKLSYGLQVPRPAMVKFFGVSVPFFETRLAPTWGAMERGDVVVFRFPGDRSKDYIKRVVGLPGDSVELREGKVFVNGQAWEDPYGVSKGGVYGEEVERSFAFGPYGVPEGTVFVMGDNRDRSYDSRYWGPVPMEDLKGRALVIYWSWNRDESWVRFGRLGQVIR